MYRLKSTNTRQLSKEGLELVAWNSLIFGTVQTKIVYKGDSQEMLYSYRYFTAGSILDDKITLTNLDFSLFTSVLLKDISFNPIKYRIFYYNS
jgi:hypothetical protein